MFDERDTTPQAVLPLTAAQRGLWFAQQLDPRNPSYNVAEYVAIPGDVDLRVLRRAMRLVSGEVAALRLAFGERDGVPYQAVSRESQVDVRFVDLSGHPDPHGTALRRMEAELSTPADIAAGPPAVTTLYRLSSDRHLFHQQVHHLALDGYSAALVLARVAEVYTHLLSSPDAVVPDRSAPLGPLIEDERAYRAGPEYATDRRFWTEYLTGAPAPVQLAGAPERLGHGCHAARGEFGAADTDRLRRAARAVGVAWPTFFMAATAVYLQRAQGVGEVLLGLPVTGRRTRVARRTPGMVADVLPMRLALSPFDRVSDALKKTSAQARSVLRHQRYPAPDLRRDRGLTGPGDRLTGPSVNVLAFDDTLRFGPHRATLRNLSVGPVEDLVVAVHASYTDGSLGVDLLGNPELYSQRELTDHHARLCRLVSAFVAAPERRLGSLRLTDDEENHRLVALAAGTDPAGPQDTASLPVRLGEQARQTPRETAVVCGDESVDFRTLDARVTDLAGHLAEHGAGPGTRVAVGLPRSADLIVAVLAVLRAGAAYLPLDPAYPADRLAFMIADSRPVALVATESSAQHADPHGTLHRIDPRATPVRQRRVGHPRPWDAAYVIYTSGSTGQPKGVVVEHRSLSNLLAHHCQESHRLAREALGRRLRVALTAATSFDASWDPLLWMVAGHELHIIDDETRRDPEALVEHLLRRRIDAIETTPTYLGQMISAGLLDSPAHRPRVVALGGEAVNEALWQRLSAHRDLLAFNFYGPTETTVNAVTARITGDGPTIGRPVLGSRAYVLDCALQPTPVGVAGELYLAGRGVARGYAGRASLTAGRFLPDPLGRPGTRMYRTGDLARWNEDGSLDFLGRRDEQVKIRGFRVETGEIETALRALPGVEEAAVLLRPASAGGPPRLVAYLVGDVRGDLRWPREALAKTLPEHMVPSAYTVLPRLPLTPNGKLDAARLPSVEPPTAPTHDAPRTPAEAAMCALFAECLGATHVGPNDDFFALGGHSLLATQLVSRARERFAADLSIRALFDSPTPAALLDRLGPSRASRPRLTPPQPRPERLPLSFAQGRLWLSEKMGQGGRAYHLPIALRLRGALDHGALSRALTDLVRRHESLRTVFTEDERGPVQQVLPAHRVRVPLVTQPPGSTPRPEDVSFALDRDLPLDARLFPTAADDHLLVLTLHHIAADGWSMGPLLRDLSEAYSARHGGRAPRWEPLTVQYADYTLWQRALLGDPHDPRSLAGRQLRSWREALDGSPAECAFPTDRPRSAHRARHGGSVPVRLDAGTHRALVALATAEGCTPFMVLHAALAALMTRMGAGHDIVVGAPVAGRDDDDLSELVGFFVNTLVLRADTSGAPRFRELLRRVREADLEAFGRPDLPFDRLVEALNPARSPGRHPLFQVMLAFNNAPTPQVRLPGLSVERDLSVGRGAAKFDLTWDLAEEQDGDGAPAGISGELEYCAALFDRATAEHLSSRYARFLGGLLAAPDLPFTDVDLLTGVEHDIAAGGGAVSDGRRPGAGRSPRRNIPDTITNALSAQADRTPRRTALVAADRSLSFRALQEQAEELARLLYASGVRHGDRVVVALPRTSLRVVAIFGVLRAGAVYVPVDPEHPVPRNRLLLDTATPRLVITDERVSAGLPLGRHRRLVLDDATDLTSADGGSLPPPPLPRDAAYVLYTSGSTGRPKGVVVEHGSLANLLVSHQDQLMAPATRHNGDLALRVALTAALTFDASWDPLLWMVSGHELHLVADDVRRDPEALTEYLQGNAVDVVETTPSFLDQLRLCGLLANGRPRPRLLALGGEAINEALWRELAELEDVAVWNVYGPTEATVDSVTGLITANTEPHLGEPIRRTGIRVLDARLRPVAPGVTGELYLSGAGLARGYAGRSSTTAARFLPDPFGAPGTRMYRTGDLVRFRAGRLEYLGRSDGQVKVRGFRVETGEVTATLTRHAGVARAAVAVRPDSSGSGQLVAWVVPQAGRHVDPGELRSFLTGRLPSYMVPAVVVPMTSLPLTPHGKTDFGALPLPETTDPPVYAEPPRSAPEEVVCALFAESLGLASVGRSADFFDLGGHSLLATRLINRVRAAFGVDLPVSTLFESATPAALARRLADVGPRRPPLRRLPRPERLPLSPAQQRLWFLNRLDATDAAYHLPVAVTLTGALDRDALRVALADVVERHESLRTLVREADDGPVQVILPPGRARPDLPVHQVTHEDVPGSLRSAATRPFDLAHEGPLRAELFAVEEGRHVLLLTAHHIAADGWSMGPLARDLAEAYSARSAGRCPGWAPLPVQYADYTLWQRELLAEGADQTLTARQLAYWRDQLAEAPTEIPLPADRPRPAHARRGGGSVPVCLPPSVAQAVALLARETATSTFMVLHAALTAVLHRIGAGDDITVGTPVAGRTDEALDGLVGFFVNTLALRVRVSGEVTFRDLLGRVRQTDLAAYAHQDLPFDRLVEELRPSRAAGHHPLFQVMLSLNNTPPPRLDLPGLDARTAGVDTGRAKFDLTLSLTEPAGESAGVEGTLEFDRDLFDTRTARNIAEWFLRLVEDATTAPDTAVRDLDLQGPDAGARLLTLGEGRRAAEPAGTILEHFAETVAAARSGEVAVTAFDGNLTFEELNRRAERVAAFLAGSGVGAGDPVAVLLPRSTQAVVALLGTLRAGAVYAPLDADTPDARLRRTLDDAVPRTVVVDDSTADRVPASWHRTWIDDAVREPARPVTASRPARPAPDSAAYLIHTSGSTGRPKGVLVSHGSLARLLAHHRQRVFAPAVSARGGARLRVALTTALSFDAAWDPLLWMLDGHHLHVIDDLTRRDPEALVHAVRGNALDVLETTPSHARQLVEAGLLDAGEHRPAVLALGGEAVPPSLWADLAAIRDVHCWNFYGPTEATVDTLTARVRDTGHPVLGAPVSGTRVYVLDRDLRPAPPGVIGDLYLAGESLALGYAGRPGETANRFVPDPHGPPGSRMYHTGDRARWRTDDTLEFAGRSDRQVKLRGFRVEPDEVRAVLVGHHSVGQAAAVVREDGATGRELVGYLVPADPATGIDTAVVRDHAASELPAHMVPSGWSVLDHLPLTASGKLDEKALPPPQTHGRPGTDGRIPRTPREDVLCQLFAESLGVDKVLIDDDFFTLGGHSLLATRLITRLRAVLGVDVSIRTLFEAPTVATLAERLDHGGEDNALAALLPLRATGSMPPLFCVHPAGGLAWPYAGLLRHLPDDQPLYGLQTPNLEGDAAFPGSIEEMAAGYVARLREVQPSGPYHLFGWSFGGNVVQEVAVQLQEAGERVALLVILDAFPLAPLDDLDNADRDVLFRALLDNLGVRTHVLDGTTDVDAATIREEFRRLGSPLGAVSPETIELMVDNFVGQTRLMRTYRPRTFHGPVLFFTATEGRPADAFGVDLWAPYITGPIDNHDVPCAHAQMMEPTSQARIGTTVAAALHALRTTPGVQT